METFSLSVNREKTKFVHFRKSRQNKCQYQLKYPFISGRPIYVINGVSVFLIQGIHFLVYFMVVCTNVSGHIAFNYTTSSAILHESIFELSLCLTGVTDSTYKPPLICSISYFIYRGSECFL